MKKLIVVIVLYCILKLFAVKEVFYDEGVYVGMAKFFMTFGHAGMFEPIRPVAMPLLLAPFAWIEPYSMSRILGILLAIGTIIAVYYIAERLWKAGFWAAILFSLSPLVFRYSGTMLNDIPAYGAVLIAAYLLYRYPFRAGLAIGVAFLFKLSTIAALPAFLIYLLYTHWKQPLDARMQPIIFFSIGAVIAAAPFFIINLIASGSIAAGSIAPITDAFGIVQTATWLYGEGTLLKYLHVLLSLETAIFAAGIIGIITLRTPRSWLFAGIAACYLFFHVFGVNRFDERYAISMLPFLAVLGGAAIQKLRPRKIESGIIVLLIALNLILVPSVAVQQHDARLADELRGTHVITNEGIVPLYAHTAALMPGANVGRMYQDFMLSDAVFFAINPHAYVCPDQQCRDLFDLQLRHIIENNYVQQCGFLHNAPLIILAKNETKEIDTADYYSCMQHIGYRTVPAAEQEVFVRLMGATLREDGLLLNEERLREYISLLEASGTTTYLVLVEGGTFAEQTASYIASLEHTLLAINQTVNSSAFTSSIMNLTGREVVGIVPQDDDWIGKEINIPEGISVTLTGSWDYTPVPVQRKGTDIFVLDVERGEIITVEEFKNLYTIFLQGDFQIGIEIPVWEMTAENHAAIKEMITYLTKIVPENETGEILLEEITTT